MNPYTIQMLRVYLADRLTRRLAVILAIVGLAFVLLSPGIASSFAGLGGYISEKLLGDATDATPYLGSSSNGPLVIASGPAISTLPVTDSASAGGVTSATLRGNLVNLNGMPRADVWWIWGYTASTMTNTTAITTVTTAGEKTLALPGVPAGQMVYYQFLASTDGTSRGTTLHFLAGGAHGTSYRMMRNILPIIIALAMLILVLIFTGNPLAALIGSIIGFLAFMFVQEALRSL